MLRILLVLSGAIGMQLTVFGVSGAIGLVWAQNFDFSLSWIRRILVFLAGYSAGSLGPCCKAAIRAAISFWFSNEMVALFWTPREVSQSPLTADVLDLRESSGLLGNCAESGV